MPGDAFVTWTEVPQGSLFKVQCDGDKNDYEFTALVTVSGQPHPNIDIHEANPGPAVRPSGGSIEKDQAWEIGPTLIVMNTLTQPINVTAWVEKNGSVVLVPDGEGNQVPAKAEWQSGRRAGSTLEFAIFIDSEVSS